MQERTRAGDRRRRLVAGGGAGSGVGALAAPVVAFLYSELTGHSMGDVVAASVGGLVGALAATVAICADDLYALLLAWVKRDTSEHPTRRRGD